MTRLIQFLALSALVCMLAQASPLPEKIDADKIDAEEIKKIEQVVRKNIEVEKKVRDNMIKVAKINLEEMAKADTKATEKKDADVEKVNNVEPKKVVTREADVKKSEEKKVSEKKSVDAKVDEKKVQEIDEIQKINKDTRKVIDEEKKAEDVKKVDSEEKIKVEAEKLVAEEEKDKKVVAEEKEKVDEVKKVVAEDKDKIEATKEVDAEGKDTVEAAKEIEVEDKNKVETVKETDAEKEKVADKKAVAAMKAEASKEFEAEKVKINEPKKITEEEEKKETESHEHAEELTTVHVVEREVESTTTEATTTVKPVIVVSEEKSWNTSTWAQNPCEARGNFNYYQSFPNDTTRYIQCDPWGTGSVKHCENGTVWNMWALKCDLKENIHNLTFNVPQVVFNCSAVGYECMNSGVCSESALNGFKCVCRPEFTGQFCENKVDLSDLTHEILNGTFSLTVYRKKLADLNITSNVAQYERYRDQLDNTTFSVLINYISLYNSTEIRYDTLINNLVESILENIYPDAAYLSSFNASSISVVQLVRLIPNLLSYSKYSLERYQDVFSKYQSVLSHLVWQLNATEPRLRNESVQYSHLTAIFMNQTIALMNQTYSNSENINALLENQQSTHKHMNETEIRDQLRAEYNATLKATERMYEQLERFEVEVQKQIKINPNIYLQTLVDSKIKGTEEVKRMLEIVSQSSVQIWESLVNYGFWFVTSTLCTPATTPVEPTAQRLLAF